LSADRPEAHLNLGLLYEKERKLDSAEAELKTSLSLDPSFAPAAVNLADLFRELGRDGDGEAILRAGLQHSPDDAALLHAFGLLMVREHQSAQALALLAAAARNDRSNVRYAYVYAVALSDNGNPTAAIKTLVELLTIHPYDRDSLTLVETLLEQSGDSVRARVYARRLRELDSNTSDRK
jgi:Flp pilus assembly protein TadD